MVSKTIRYKKNRTPSTVMNFRNLVIIMRISTFYANERSKEENDNHNGKRNRRIANVNVK